MPTAIRTLELRLANSDRANLCGDYTKLLARHDGLELYCDPLSETCGIEFYPIHELDQYTKEMVSRYGEIGDGFLLDSTNKPLKLAIGEICHSGNYFAINRAGNVFYINHDDWITEPLSATFADFLNRIVGNPAKFLNDMGCYTRYYDGTSDIQWVPETYFDDVEKIGR